MGFEDIPQEGPEQQERERHTLETKNGHTIVVEEESPGVFKIVENSVTEEGDSNQEATGLAFKDWDEGVENEDVHSDLEGNMSENLVWEDVEITPNEIKAPSLEKAQEALRHIGIESYIPGDI